MTHARDLSGLIKFAGSPAWAEHLAEVLAEHLRPAMEAFDLSFEKLADVIDEHWALVLWGCAFEDLVTRTVEPDGRNLADDYLKRRGWNESVPVKRYIRALRASVMSLYEVSQIKPGTGFLVRDLIRGGEPVMVSEYSASQTLKAWERIAARVVPLGTKHVLTGGLLSFNVEASDAFIAGLSDAAGKRRARATRVIDDEALRTMAPLISTAWLFDTIPRLLGPVVPVLHNSDGEEVVFHRVRFPLARGATQSLVGELLDTVPALQRENAHIWSWLEIGGGTSTPSGRASSNMRMSDGTPVLGAIELKGSALILAVTSAARALRGRTLIDGALGDLVGVPLTEIETVEQALAARSARPRQPEPAIAPEIATPLVHGMLDRQYRSVLDERVPMLGNVTPRTAARTKAGRDRIVAWLKHLETMSGRQSDPNDPMATYDFTWIWHELGVEALRR